MSQIIKHIALVVQDYDDAIEFYTKKLNFDLIEDTVISKDKRWVIVAPKGSQCSILLANAKNEQEQNVIGNQTGGRVFLFLNTNTFNEDYKNLIKNKIRIVREPKEEEYGRVLVFEDLYGNLWDLIENK